MKKEAIVFDLDGTALDSPVEKLPSDRLVAVVDKLKDQYFLCAATGRCWTFAKDVIGKLNLEDLCIISGGTQIYNPKTGEVVWQKDIFPQALSQVVEIFTKNGEQKIIFNDYTEEDYFSGGTYPRDFNVNQKVNWMSQSFVPDKKAIELHAKLDKVEGITCVMVVSQKPGCRDLHIVNEEATKEHAIAELLKRIGLTRENTTGIGDGHNDLHIFNAVDKKIAMGNAVDDLKKRADLVIGTVKEGGLAKYLETLF